MSTEQASRDKLAELSRILDYENLIDGFGHVSYKLDYNTILVTPHMPPGKATAGDFISVDRSGKHLSGAGKPPGEIAIHTAVYRHRPEIRCVLHFHPPKCILLSVLGQEILPLTNTSVQFHEGTPIYERPELIVNDEQGEAMMSAMGGKCKALFIRGHGVVVVGENTEQVAVRAVALERAADFQYQAMVAGDPKRYSAEDVERTSGDEPKHVNRTMNYYRYIFGHTTQER